MISVSSTGDSKDGERVCKLALPTNISEKTGEYDVECPFSLSLAERLERDEQKTVTVLGLIQIEGTAPVLGEKPKEFPKPPIVYLRIANVDAVQGLRVKLAQGQQFTTIAVGALPLEFGGVGNIPIVYEHDQLLFLGVGGACDYEILGVKLKKMPIPQFAILSEEEVFY